MMKEKDIHTLVARFLDGETTLEEERRLYAFFQGENVPEDLKEYQEMFRGYASLSPTLKSEKSSAKRIPLWWRAASVAACFLVVSLIGYTLYIYNHQEVKEVIKVKEVVNDSLSKPSPTMIKPDELIAEVKTEVRQEMKEVEEKEVKQERPMSEETPREEPKPTETLKKEPMLVAEVEEVVPTAIYASNETTDSTYQDPSRMDEFIVKFAAYNEVEPVSLKCSQKNDSTMSIAAYIFPDTKEVDVFARLLQCACWYDDATPGYHLNFSHLQFFFELKDERKGLKYLWIADRINGKILLYSTHSPIGTTVSSECYQGLRDELMHANGKATYQL